jgi:hypothetical protein
MLREQPDRTINAATHLEISNAALDADVPANHLSYRLIEAPPGAEMDADGVIRWSPRPEEVPSQSVFTTIVTDDGLPPLSSTNSFKVQVLDWAHSGPVGIVAGPILNPANQHQYFLLKEASWTNAEATAVAMGGHLVTVNDQEEHIWLRRTFSSYDSIDRALWIGLIDPDPSMTWSPDFNAWVYHFVWASGQPITFFCWSTSGQFSQGAGRLKMCQPDPLWPWGQGWRDYFWAACCTCALSRSSTALLRFLRRFIIC